MTNHPNALAVEDPGKAIEALIYEAEMYAARDKSTFAGLDNNLMNRPTLYLKFSRLLKAQAQSLLSAVETEVIGPDEPQDGPGKRDRNDLRHEARLALNKIKEKYQCK